MTFTELQQKIGPQNENDWTQHKDGGWVYKSAKVSQTASVSENAIVSKKTINRSVIQ